MRQVKTSDVDSPKVELKRTRRPQVHQTGTADKGAAQAPLPQKKGGARAALKKGTGERQGVSPKREHLFVSRIGKEGAARSQGKGEFQANRALRPSSSSGTILRENGRAYSRQGRGPTRTPKVPEENSHPGLSPCQASIRAQQRGHCGELGQNKSVGEGAAVWRGKYRRQPIPG